MSQPALSSDLPRWEQARRYAWIATGIAVVLCVIGAVVSFEEFLRSYLVAFLFWVGIALGGLAVVMLHHLTGGAWGLLLRRLMESAARTLPLLAVLFLPIAVGVPHLYKWGHAEWAVEYRALHGEHGFDKADYLTPAFFIVRTVAYFALWLTLAFVLSTWSRRLDRAGQAEHPRGFRRLSAAGLVVYGLTITMASIDWVMSLEPEWYSTLFGVLFGTGQVLSGFAFAVAVVLLLAQSPPLREAVTPDRLRDLGNLLLAFVMLWAYMSFSQFLLIWSGNLVEEIPWYLRRGQGGWQYVAGALAVLHFAFPFLLLLSRDVKRNPRLLLGVALLVLVMRFVDLCWLVLPSFDAERGWGLLKGVWLDLAAVVAVGGVWITWFVWQLRQAPVLPIGTPVSVGEASHE